MAATLDYVPARAEASRYIMSMIKLNQRHLAAMTEVYSRPADPPSVCVCFSVSVNLL